MTATTTIILGGGWGGLTAAHHLRGLVSSEHRILVIERSATFSLGVSNLGLMTGERQSVRQISRDMANLKRPGIEWVHAEVTGLDPEARTVETNVGNHIGDHLVVALGTELAPEAIPGFEGVAHNLYDAEGAIAIHEDLEQCDGGRIAVLVAGAPFRCPAAPYEAAMLLEAWAREQGIRDRVDIDVYTPEGIPMAVAGPEIGAALCAFMDDRGIGYHFNRQVARIDATSHMIEFEDGGPVAYDLLVGIPPHRVPKVLQEAGLIDSSGYVPVHPQTLELLSDVDTLAVHYPGVYAIGDVAAVRLLNSMLLPKAGVFAEGEAQVVAAAIAAAINGEPKPRGFDGHGFCYVDVGDGLAAYGTGDFYAYPGPRVTMQDPTTRGRRAKEEYEDLLDIWFSVES
ncbi:MAG: FAD/NAD(P)-binding oxidoreductase [Acidimicrobiia bacterium]|nr:FAD/NAD(P)-binding oxidoreductase [Acidimicrobiia bacterium]